MASHNCALALPPRDVGRLPPKPMSRANVCNVELISLDELYDALTPVLDAMGLHRAIEELDSRWELGPIDPAKCDVA